jgi:diguanylate cyclase (GGDEF)-like protein
MVKTTILLVQYAQTQGNGTKRFLDTAGYDVIWVGSGASALTAATQQPLDLILLDVALPDIEGSDLCRRFRSRDETSTVPIILLVAPGYTPDPSAGSDDYLTKPYTERELNASISTALKTRMLKNELEKNRLLAEQSSQADALKTRILKNELEEKNRLLDEQRSQADALKTRMLKNELEEKDRLLAEQHAPAEPPAIVDPATGLFSRQQFEAMFSKEFKRAVRFKQQMSCMLIDLDGREMGRTVDEETLKAIVRLVQDTIREVDTAAWWSGEALIILLPNTIRNDAVLAAARILETVANHPFTWPDSSKVTMSIGVAGLPYRSIDTEQKLIEAAASACKRARKLMPS